MKRWMSIVAIIAVLAIAGYALFQRYKIYIPGIIGELRDPIAAPQTVTWARGPDVPPQGKRPPNIVLIVADDLGINDITLTGRGVAGQVPTPNIDSIGHDGITFTNGYAANATCSPSRAAIMTGRYPPRFGFEFTAVPPSFAANVAHASDKALYPVIYHEELNHDLMPYAEMGVPHDQIMIGEVLQPLGYHTMHIGKWHLGEAKPLQPGAQGFDEWLGMLAGGGMFMERGDPGVVNAKLPWDPIDRFLWANLPYAVQWNGGQRFKPTGHLTDYLTDQAVAAIAANRNRPFFLYLAYNAPHTPLQATRADYDALPGIKDHTQRVYGAMIRQLDRDIGKVLAAIKAQGLEGDTIVIFTSDNGGAWYTGIPDLNAPYRGWKANFFEGGIKVPLMMRWPGQIAPGSTDARIAGHLDFFATIVGVAGAPMPTDRVMDSNDLLTGLVAARPGTPVARQRMFWRSGDYRAVREGNWKLQVAKRPDKAWLFDLGADPTERTNLAGANPAKVAELRQVLEVQNTGLPRPLWPGLVEAPMRIDVPLNAPWTPDQEYVYWTN